MALTSDKVQIPVRMRLGHQGRLRREAMPITLVFLAYFLVFVASLFHDEAAAEIAAAGWIHADRTELAEVVIGFFLFVIWGYLSVVLVRYLDRVRAGRAKA